MPGNGGGDQQYNTGLTTGEGGGWSGPPPDWSMLGGGGAPAPAPAPEPAAPDWAENRQVANIDRTSAYAHREYRAALEQIDQTARASSPDMPVQPGDYELPDTAFGQRLY